MAEQKDSDNDANEMTNGDVLWNVVRCFVTLNWFRYLRDTLSTSHEGRNTKNNMEANRHASGF